MEALQAMGNWSKRHNYPFYFGTEASINLAKEEKLLQLMRENDFRHVFVGIESPDEEVLTQAQKVQNKGVCAVEAVRTLASYGMTVSGGFILGFDNETENTARQMIDLIQEAGICVAMVGTLVALPNTQLSRRLKREGRLFSGGQMRIETAVDIDQTTSGLNFATTRPRSAILQDQVQVFRHIYDPKKYYERVLLTAIQLAPAYKNRPSFAQALKLAWAFLKVSAKAGISRRTGPLYWKTLFKVLTRNPRAVSTAVNMAAVYVHFSRQSEFVIRTLEERAEYTRSYGEENYNKLMIAERMVEA
jgi:radical SAM superfamily enzyme YgiQ (UPF0313 family)